MPRCSALKRSTKETDIALRIEMDGEGQGCIETGVGFFDHMLTLLAKHSLINLEIKAKGDLQVDAHHTVEDVGLLLGQAIRESLGDKKGIVRYGSAIVPMDEARVQVALDLSGRPHLVYEMELQSDKVGEFDTCLAREFFQALANSAAMNLHVEMQAGVNDHHIIEAAFKALGRALRQAASIDPREKSVPSSKGVL
mgnify:CR=1 FL=1